MNRRLALLALGVPVVASLIAAAPASAHTPAPASSVVTTYWATSLASGVTTPKTAADITWPQRQLTSVPACHGWIQVDQWRLDANSHDEIGRILAAKVLNKGQDDWFTVSWRFIPPVLCAPPTMSHPSSPVVSLSSSPAQGHPTSPATSPALVPAVQTPAAPSSGVGTGEATAKTPPVSSSPGSAPQLAVTGADPALTGIVGALIVAVGGLVTFAGRRRGGHS